MEDAVTRNEWAIERDGQVGWIRFKPVTRPPGEFREPHTSMGLSLEELRWDDSVRVVVVAGADDWFENAPYDGEIPTEIIDPATCSGPGSLRNPWSMTKGIERAFEALVLMEKPVIGRLMGDAFGFAGHVLWGCDVI